MPMMPSRLPQMRRPSIQVGDQPPQALSLAQHRSAFGQPARNRKDQRHGHVGGILGEDARRVGHRDAAAHRGGDIDVVDAVAEIGDQLELLAGLAEDADIDAVGHGGHEHVGDLRGLGEIGLAHRFVVEIEAGIEQFAHARLDDVRQLAGDDNQRLPALRHARTRSRN